MSKLKRSSVRVLLAMVALTGSIIITGDTVGQEKTFPVLGPLPPVPIPRDNPQTPAKVELGKLLFFDPRTSGDASTSCASCHDPKQGWGDGGDLSRGYPGTQQWSNSQAGINSAYLKKLFWAGGVGSLESQAIAATTGNLAGNGSPEMIQERLRQIPEYVRRFKEVFGELPTFDKVVKAISAFERTLVSDARNVPFDRYMRGDKSALSDDAKKGLTLFQGKARCIQCHNGPLFTDEDFHDLAVPNNTAFTEDPLRQIAMRFVAKIKGVPNYMKVDRDLGLFLETKRNDDIGKFRTPPLRELQYTAPYMHNGVFFTLEEVIDFYDKGGGNDANKSSLMMPLGLTAEEKKALLVFLESLSSTEPIMVEAPVLPEYETSPGAIRSAKKGD
ncbi:MAG: cytochrome-c peroxidase [Deltaproteobacteria bacterium]|nr:cytochrome-c peroxidase [Deltaproteobacteria bacterium]